MDVVKDFFTFFNNIIVGHEKEKSTVEQVPSIIESNNVMDSLSAKVKNSMAKYENTSMQNFDSGQKITVDCGSDKLTDWHLKKRGEKYTWLGEKIPYTGCIQYGCCYDITQRANIKLSAINETTVEDHQEMYNEIKQELNNQVSLVVGNDPKPMKILNSAMSQVQSTSIDHIKKHMENISQQDVEGDQEIIVKSLSPLRCKNQCNQKPTAGYINQSLNVEITAENIITDISKSVSETYITMVSKTDSSITTVDMNKIYTFAILSVLLIVTVYIICYMLVHLLHAIALKKPAKPIVAYIGALFLLILIYFMYAIILCIIRSGGGFKMMFCMF
jgi:hypothetical protein